MVSKCLFSSACIEWGTPQDKFDEWNREFHFEIDLAATKKNAKCEKFFTKKQDSLKQNWNLFKVCFLNSPYGRGITEKWVRKAWLTSVLGDTTVVCLLPARTDTKWWHRYCMQDNAEIRLLRGRIKFVGPDGVKHSAPFPSALVIFRPTKRMLMLGAPKRRQSDVKPVEIVSMWRSGWSMRKISRELGTSWSTVRYWLRKNGFCV